MIVAAGGRPGEAPYVLIGLTHDQVAMGPVMVPGSCFPQPLADTPLRGISIVVITGASDEQIRSALVEQRIVNIDKPPVVEDHRGGGGRCER